MIEAKRETRNEVWAVRILAILIALGFLILGFFGSRLTDVDELGLYNPVYTSTHYGKMTYPVHGEFDRMTVHPPVHYFLIARLMRLGLGVYYAEAVPVLFFAFVALLLISQGLFPTPVKLGLMFGLFTGTALVPNGHLLIMMRPDTHLTAAWLSGLLALESARLDGWEFRKLFLGGFLLTYASGIHYFGAPAFAGILPYAVWAYRALGFPNAKARILAMIAGGTVFGLPYLLLFALPYWHPIRWTVASVDVFGGGVAGAIHRHLALYESLANQLLAAIRQGQLHVIAIPMLPVLSLPIPLLFTAVAGLFAIPSTRGMALAGLPLPLFVFLFLGRKWGIYLLPEYVLYLSAAGVGGMTLLAILTCRLLPLRIQQFILPVAAVAIGVAVLFNGPRLSEAGISLAPRVHEMEIARAATREIVGPNALVGGRIGLWYSTGAAHWYDISRDLLYRRITGLDVKRYLSWFDAVAEHGHMSNVTFNERRAGLFSWYLDGTLRLKGFYVDNHGNALSHLSSLLFNTELSPQVLGYGRKGSQLYRFEQSSGGNYMFAAMACPREDPLGGALFLDRFLLPRARESDLQGLLIVLIMPRDAYHYKRAAMALECRMRDEIPGRLLPVDVGALLAKLAREDLPIRFYQTFADAVAHRGVIATSDSSEVFSLQRRASVPIFTANFAATMVRNSAESEIDVGVDGAAARIITNYSAYDWQLVSRPIAVKPRSLYLFEFERKILRGGAGVYVLGADRRTVLVSNCEYRPESGFVRKQFAFNTGEHSEVSVVVSNCAYPKPAVSAFWLKDLKIWGQQ